MCADPAAGTRCVLCGCFMVIVMVMDVSPVLRLEDDGDHTVIVTAPRQQRV